MKTPLSDECSWDLSSLSWVKGQCTIVASPDANDPARIRIIIFAEDLKGKESTAGLANAILGPM